ncbi:MAG: hypothetical protein D6702_05920 [Planctomycetota bacterium]|nr:MAG: hypothetical protein D6702_05920 [Planctomycetota bacterium]
MADQLWSSGVLLFGLDGYLGFRAADSTFQDNRGNGITLDAPVSAATMIYPAGIYLEAVDCGIHRNGGNGIAYRVGTADPQITRGSAIAGGTWDIYPSPPAVLSLADKGDEPTSLGHGQGLVDRCTISNNGLATGGAGIRVYAESEDPAGGNARDAIVNTRFVNVFVWNNGGGAFLAQFLGDRAWLLTPLVHCTLIGNGAAAPAYTAEVVPLQRANGQPSVGNFEWQETPSYYLRNRLFDSIFLEDPGNPASPDFGLNLSALLLGDNNPSGYLNNGLSIGAAGCRSYPNQTYLEWTDHAPPFAVTINLSSLAPEQFFLQPATGILNPDFDHTPPFLSVDAPETAVDFLLTPRPAVSTGDRDKGAHQFE